jgi:transposase-like protein
MSESESDTDTALTVIGRPSKYRPEFAEQAYKLCLLMGATDADLAAFFEVHENTILAWKAAHLAFKDALALGKTQADMHLASKLYNRAEGAQWIEEQAFKVKREIFDDNGKKIATQEEIVTVPVKRGAAPDTTALIFWLKNRDPKRWRDRHELQHTGKDGESLPEQRALSVLPAEALIELLAINDRLTSSAAESADEPGDNPG